jgi:GNAT superfamily N-acetyltransferase
MGWFADMIIAPVLRAGRDGDGPDVIALLTECWLEYPGCVVDIDGEVPELHALASYFAAAGGEMWVAEAEGRVVGMIGTRPLANGEWELCKLYAYAGQRGSGLARNLYAAMLAHVRAEGGTGVRLWTDTRFERAHQFYEKLGFVQQAGVRELHDLSNSIEFEYFKAI